MTYTLTPSVSVSDTRTVRQRQCLADFMDAHPEAFPLPGGESSWAGRVGQPDEVPALERRLLDRALGLVVAAMRSASSAMHTDCSLTDLFDRAQKMGALDFEPDAGTLAIALSNDGEPAEAVAYAKAIAVYRQCIAKGSLDGSELSGMVMFAFDRLPVVTPLMRSAIDAGKRMVQIDIDCMLNPEQSHAQV